MGKLTLRDVVGLIKDKASQSKAALLTKPTRLSLHLAVLRATTHTPSAPPDDHHISSLLSLGDSSRTTASALISTLMDRLHRTTNSTVALKCLLIIHHIIKRGPFILQDQLSIFPSTGGYNYLKLSAFRDGATATSWALSAWVRWYAGYLETILSTSRVLGYFLCSSCSGSVDIDKERQERKLSSFLNSDLIKEADSLVVLIEEMCKLPDTLLVEGNKLLYEIVGLLTEDHLSAINETLSRLNEFKERLELLSFGESVELICTLKRLEDCKERFVVLFSVKKPSTETLWRLVEELKIKIGAMKSDRDGGSGGRKLLTWGGTGREKASESARFGDRFLVSNNSVRFSSGRFNKVSLFVVESIEPVC